jgi:ABC-type Fe3+/spermidine/putrescine transport system ATPase subunit
MAPFTSIFSYPTENHRSYSTFRWAFISGKENGMIKLTQLTKVFDARGIAGLHSVNLLIPRGTIFALMGPNGSGKTTLLNLISNKLNPDSGTVEVEGKIHFFEKKNPEIELNVQRFLMESVLDQEIDTDKKLQLSRDMADIFEFTFQLRQNIGQLSQGQLQKVLMAAELINKPDILFLDEPFIHLDPMSRKDILDSLFTYLRQREVTVLWITHERDEALKFADQVGLIQHGKLEQVSTPVEILQKPRNLFVAQYFGHQNFIKVSGHDNIWSTPWGDFSFNLSASEGFLVVPPMSWTIDDNSPFEGIVNRQFPQYFAYEIELEVLEKRYKISLPLDAHKKIKVGQKLKVSADLSHCFVIPL